MGSWRSAREAALARDRGVLYLGLELALNLPREAKRAGPASPEALRGAARTILKGLKSPTPYLGVWRVGDAWQAKVPRAGHAPIHCGEFIDAKTAAIARDRVLLSVQGARAILNFPDRHLEPATVEEMRAWAKALRRERVGPPKMISERYAGVKLVCGRYEARIKTKQRDIYLGRYDTERAAAVARDRAILGLRLDLPLQERSAARRLGPASPAEIYLAARMAGPRFLSRVNPQTPRSERFVGVSKSTVNREFRYTAYIGVRGRIVTLGAWRTAREAALAHDRAALVRRGASFLNFPDEARAAGPATPDALRREARRRWKQRTTSRFRGVHWNRKEQGWVAQIGHRGRTLHLGRFSDEERAAEAYDEAAKQLKKHRAVLNFPGE
jgi:hypothetical protein